MIRLLASLLAGTALAAGDSPPRRLASFSPAATRILVDLGQADRLVGATRWCELPGDRDAPRICDAFEPDLERLTRARPDAVILPRLANPLLADRLRAAGFAVEMLAEESPESPAIDIAMLGRLTGSQAKADELLQKRRILRPPSGRRVLVIWDGVLAGPKSYLAWVIHAAGGEPAPRQGQWPAWEPEAAALSNPDLVLYLTEKGPAQARLSPERLALWRSTPALRSTICSRKGYIFEIQAGTDWLPGSGLPQAVRILAELMDSHQ